MNFYARAGDRGGFFHWRDCIVSKSSLTVHRNTLARRHRKEMRAHADEAVAGIFQKDIRAFAIVAFDSNGKAYAAWDTGSIMPMWSFPPAVGEVLRRDMDDSGADETWRPSLNEISRPGIVTSK